MIFKLLKFKLAIGRKMSRADLLIDWVWLSPPFRGSNKRQIRKSNTLA